MEELKKHEQFEIEVLQLLHNKKILDRLTFAGGTMLRLCHGLDRYSVDLDFWLYESPDTQKLFTNISDILKLNYELLDCQSKYYSLIFEIRSSKFPKRLKIEIRKEDKKIKTEKSIAFSPFSNIQVLLRTVALDEMVNAKIKAFLNRKEIRDAYDLEFLVKKGVNLNLDFETAEKIIQKIESLSQKDYKVKLGSIIPAEMRPYYLQSNFRILKAKLNEMQ